MGKKENRMCLQWLQSFFTYLTNQANPTNGEEFPFWCFLFYFDEIQFRGLFWAKNNIESVWNGNDHFVIYQSVQLFFNPSDSRKFHHGPQTRFQIF